MNEGMENLKEIQDLEDKVNNAPDDSDNDFLCAVQLQRIATSLEEILRLVKEDQERMKKLND
jgi:thioredoxin-like negative regulator of GroEL|tara:strand:+ start:747 stop:932 length:186 start_codon:yes stop_codon:yes gene_type:complete